MARWLVHVPHMEEDDELDSLPEFDPDADVLALVIHRLPESRAKSGKPAKKRK